MAQTPEGQVKDAVDKFLRELEPNCWYFKPMNFGYGRKGIPDFVGCYKGRFFSIETKRKGGKQTPWQDRECAAVGIAGGLALREISKAVDVKLAFVQAGWM